jgi:type I restriction enzyme, S subunit
MTFPRYPKYKDSDVEWLGKVPEHWRVISIKWLSPVKRGASPRPIDDPKYFDDDGEFAWVRIADVSACNGVLKVTMQRLSELGSSLSVKIAPGELFVSIAGTVGKPCLSAIKACIHDGFVYFPTLKSDPLFLYRIFEGGTCYGGLGKWGTQLNLNTDTIGSIRIALPPSDELKEVLAFLDREMAKIDGLVGEQRQLMELLKEKRQAVISHAVTRGLNPHAPMKPSGIEWLGDVPEHWEVTPLKYVVSLRSGGTPSKTNPAYWDGDVPWASAKDLKTETLSDTQDHITQRAVDDGAAELVPVGSLLIVVRGMILVHTFPVVKALVPMAINQDLKALTPSPKLNVDFLAWLLRGASRETISRIDEAGHGTKVLRIETWTSIALPLPPIDEQLEIVSGIVDSLRKLDALTAEAQRAIDLLQERRTALIAAAVTGQIDVRATTEKQPA